MRLGALFLGVAVVSSASISTTNAQSSLFREAVSYLNTSFSGSQASLLILSGTKMWHFNQAGITYEFDFRNISPNYELGEDAVAKLNCIVAHCVSGTGDRRTQRNNSVTLRFSQKHLRSVRVALDYIFSDFLSTQGDLLPAKE